MLEKLTVIIPTYNREQFALRSIQYWKSSRAIVHILDGSAVESVILRDAAMETDTVHYHFIPDSFKERLKIASGLITTKYAILCADDEFMIFTGISSCMDFLDNNKDYQQCVGRVLSFQRTFLNSVTLSPIKSRHRFHHVDQENPLDRISYHISNFNVTTIYGVHTAPSLRACLNVASSLITANPYAFETVFELVAASMGKSKVLPYLSWLRSTENKPVNANNFNRHDSISTWFSNQANSDQVSQMFSLLEGHLAQEFPYASKAEASLAIKTAMDNRIKNFDRESHISVPEAKVIFRFSKKLYRIYKKISFTNLVKISSKKKYLLLFIHKIAKKEGIVIIDKQELLEIFNLIINSDRLYTEAQKKVKMKVKYVN